MIGLIHKNGINSGKRKVFFRYDYLSSLFLFLIFTACCFTSGCGYRFRTTGEPLGVILDSIAIPLFTSSSSLSGVEADFTRIVREEFIRNSKIRIQSRDTAEALLSGRIYSITTEPLTYAVTQQTIHGILSTDEVTSSRTLKVKVAVTLKERRTGNIMWQDSGLMGQASFSVSHDPLANRHNQRQAFISIARDLAIRIYSRTMERF